MTNVKILRLTNHIIDPNPPSPDGWLICPNCGWMALETRPPNRYASELGDTCKYDCGGVLQRATAEDMKRAYPNGVYEVVVADEYETP